MPDTPNLNNRKMMTDQRVVLLASSLREISNFSSASRKPANWRRTSSVSDLPRPLLTSET